MKTRNKKGEPSSHGYDKRLVYAAAAIVVMLILAGLFFRIYSNYSTQPKAAIIDPLSSLQLDPYTRHINETFIEKAEELLSNRFSRIDYYKDNATVENYRRLASEGYKLIIWRAHSALDLDSGYVAISTCENYSQNKYTEYSSDQLTLCNITDDEGNSHLYFAITPTFVREVMGGRFEDTVLIFMSCNGLKQGYYATAEAFEEKGVKVFISWNAWIDPQDNDEAIALLLDYLINGNKTINEAVEEVNKVIENQYLSTLLFHPTGHEAANYVIPDYRDTAVGSSMGFSAITVLKKRAFSR
jgi:hypothetical protein